MTSSLEIRDVRITDIFTLGNLRQQKQLLTQNSRHAGTANKKLTDFWKAQLKLRITDPYWYCCLGEFENNIVGYIIAEIDQTDGVIHELVTELHAIPRGTAEFLWAPVRDWFCAHGICRVKIAIPSPYAVEYAFWYALGAKKKGNEFWLTI